MQPSARTPSSILRKRPSQEEQNRRKSLRAKGRRVSFAPDDELETRHLFSIDKNSPAPPPQDAQPLSELQNQMGPPASHDFPGPAAAAGASKPWSSGDRMHGQQPEQDMLLKPLHNTLQQPDAYLLSPEPAGTPQSMDLTNDTMQSAGGLGGFPGFSLRDENDSMELGGHAAAGGGLFAGRDGTYNITGDVPKLSALLEEDEEGDGTTPAGSGDEAMSEGLTMELTGNTMHTPAAAAGGAGAQAAAGGGADTTPTFTSPATRRKTRGSSASDAGGAAAAAAVPAASPTPRRSTRRSSAAQDVTPPGPAATGTPLSPARSTPRGRGRRSTSNAAASPAAAGVQLEQDGTPQPLVSPARRGRSSAAGTAAAAAAAAAGSALKGPAPSLDPTPSPLRRLTRSMASPLSSPVLGGPWGPAGAASGALGGQLAEGFTDTLLARLQAGGGGAGGGGGSKAGRRSSMGRFAEQQSRWGFVPGDEDTLNINMDVPGATGLGDTTLHHVYADSTGTGELTASMRGPGQHAAAMGPPPPAAGSSAALRAGGRRRSSVGRRMRQSLAAEVIPEESLTPQPPAAAVAAAAAGSGAGGGEYAAAEEAQQEQEAAAAAVTPAAAARTPAAADTPAGEAGDELTQDMDMDISMTLWGATPGLLGDSHLTPMHGWRSSQQQQYDVLPQQLDTNVLPNSPGLGAGEANTDVDADAGGMGQYGGDEDAAPASPDASPAAAAGGLGGGGYAAAGDVEGLTTNLLLDDRLEEHRQLPGWGHVPLGGAAALGRASLGATGGLNHTGRGSVGSNVLTMHSHRFGQTTQLLANSASKELREGPIHSMASLGLAATAAAGRGGQQQPYASARQHSTTPAAAAAAGADARAGGFDDHTTKLLADSTSASGIMGGMPQQQQPRVGLLHSSTIAGGAPVLHPALAVAGPFGRHPVTPLQQQEEDAYEQQQQQERQQQQEEREDGQQGYGLQGFEQGGQGMQGPGGQHNYVADAYQISPELGVRAGRSSMLDADMVEDSQPGAFETAAAAADTASPVDHWTRHPDSQLYSQQQQQQQYEREDDLPAASPMVPPYQHSSSAAAMAAARSPSLSPLAGTSAAAAAAAAAAVGRGGSREADEPTLELAAGGTTGVTGLQGQSLLEDATLEDFALPPDMMAAAGERPITMPFSGALPTSAGPVAHTPGGSVVRTAQPITFSDFCQVADMQFLTHIRRGTSISVADFAPSSMPQDLSKALELLSVTSCEVSVLEGAMHSLQAEMHAKRREAYKQEDRLGSDNPPVFATVQTSRPTQLEQTKHCLVLHKKACRSQTASSWKALRVHMEQQLADKLAQQQADLDDQLAFVQAKLQKAQQQREYAKAFHADVLKKLAAEEVAQQEASAARARLVCLRSRLGELRGLNADRQQRATELQERLAETETKRSELGAELAALKARREQLSSVVASTPKPAASKRVLQRLQQSTQQLQLLQSLQGCKLVGDGSGGLVLTFQSLLGVRLRDQQPSAAAAAGGGAGADDSTPVMSGRLVMLPTDAEGVNFAAHSDFKLQLLRDMVAALQSRCSFLVSAPLVREALTDVEAVAGRVLDLTDACHEVFLTQPLLTAVSVRQQHRDSAAAAAGGSNTSGSSSGAGDMDVDGGGKGAKVATGVKGVGEGEADAGGVLVLTLVEPDARVKLEVQLNLRELLAHAHPGTRRRGLSPTVRVLLAPKEAAAGGLLQQRLQEQLDAAVQHPHHTVSAMPGGSIGMTEAAVLLRCVCATLVDGIKG